MAIRDNSYSAGNPWKRRANQEWELAGCARRDGDLKDAERHTQLAREYEEKAREWEGTR